MYKWEKLQVFDVLDTIYSLGLYPSMLSSISYIKNEFKIGEKTAKNLLMEWIKRKKQCLEK